LREAAVAAQGLGTGLDRVAAPRHGLSADPHPGPVVAGEEALGVGDGHLAVDLGVGGHELGDLGAGTAAALVQFAQQRRLALGGDLGRPLLDRLRRARHGLQRARLGTLGAQRRGGLTGCALQVTRVEPIDVGEVGGGAAEHPDPGALPGAGLHRFEPRLVDRHRQPGRALGEDLGELAAVGERLGENALGDLRLDQTRAAAHAFARFPATSISRPAATKSSPPDVESAA
jgi:hypothetical protein